VEKARLPRREKAKDALAHAALAVGRLKDRKHVVEESDAS
jgi:hypothetical protein